MNDRVKLERKIQDNQEEVRVLKGRIGTMNHTPRSDPSYSVSKLDTWVKDLERLQAKDLELNEQLASLINSPSYQKEVAEVTARLVSQRDALKDELQKTEEQSKAIRYSSTVQIIEGKDPVKLVEQLYALTERSKVLVDAIGYITNSLHKMNG